MEKEKTGGKFLIMDGHSLAYRAFFALPLELQTKKGLHTNAVLGFTRMLLRLLQDESPDYLLVTFDYPAPTFRHQTYSRYKATREKTPGEMTEQMPLVKEILQAFNISFIELEGYEADDLIGTFAVKGEEAGLDTFIVTADADAYQLLTPKVKVLITRKGISQLEVFSIESLQEKYGLTPGQWIDFKALKGDSSDNIPGVPGIGEKRAMQLLKEYGALEEVIRHVNDIPGKVGKSLSAYTRQALISKDLVTIQKDIPLDLEVEACRLQTPDWQSLYKIFRALEFNNIIDKIPELAKIKNGAAAKAEANSDGEGCFQQTVLWDEKGNGDFVQPSEEKQRLDNAAEHEAAGLNADSDFGLFWVNNVEDLQLLIKELKEVHTVTLLPDTLSPRENGSFPGLFCAVEGKGVYYIPLNEQEKITPGEVLDLLKPVFENPEQLLLVHDLKPLMKYLMENGIDLKCAFFDTLLAAYLLEPERPAYPLSLLYEEYEGLSLPEPEKGVGEEQARKERLYFLTLCTLKLNGLKETLLAGLEARKLKNLYFELELPLVRVLAKMELRGIDVRKDVLEELAAGNEKSMAELEKEIMELAGMEFNLNSPRQLSNVLFEHLNLPVIRRIKTGYSTDARVLQELSVHHPVVEKILEYRMLSKLKTTYLEGLKPLISPSGKIHTTFNQTVTATGRLSSKDPNLQNIPVRLEEGRRLRNAFTPSHAGNLLLAADYSQIELRIMAHLSQDTGLIDAFRKDQDIHTRTAAEVFNVPLAEVTSIMRSRAKAVNFGIIYGISDYGLSQGLHISRAEAREYIKSYFERYPGVKKYAEECISEAREKGYVTTVMNRRRYLRDINHRNHSRRSFAERMARNTPIQGSAADIIKAAMISIDYFLEEEGFQAAMLLQVHDELIFDVPRQELEEVSAKVKSLMESVLPLSVPLKVDLRVGRDWYHLEPIAGG
jgi:DNA polymerase-1